MPDEVKEEEKPLILTPEAEKLLTIFAQKEKVVDDINPEKINISQTFGHVAFWYEKLRNAVDYQEEHLLRKNTIRRIIARKFNIPIPSTEKISISLLRELSRARYLNKTEYAKIVVDKIEKIIDKYAIFRKEIFSHTPDKKTLQKNKLVLDIISCELEEVLVNHDKEEALAGCMVSVMKRRFKPQIDEEIIKDLHIYVAVHRTLLKSDLAIIRYQFLKRRFPVWFNLKTEKEILAVYEKFFEISEEIDTIIFDPIVDKLQKTIRKKTAPFYILGETIKHNLESAKSTFSNVSAIKNLVENICQEHYAKTKSKLRRSVTQSIIYIFFTKMVLGVLLELPYDLLTLGYIHYLPLGINLLFPPTFMFVVTSGVKVPDWQNTEKILAEIKNIIYQENKAKEDISYSLKTGVSRSKTKTIFLTLLYLLTFILTFGVIIWILSTLKFNLISGILFFFFLSIVSFFAFRIRQNTRELFVLEEKEGLGAMIADFFFMPFLRIGRWLSVKFAGVNIFLIFLDFIIEAPFKTVLEVIEDWVAFMKEKKEELT